MRQHLREHRWACGLAKLDRNVERVGARVGKAVDDAAYILDLNNLDVAEGAHQLLDDQPVGHREGQLVHDPVPVTLQDLDPDQVDAGAAQRSREGAERTGAVRQPHPHHVSSHASRLSSVCERRVAATRTVAKPSGRGLHPADYGRLVHDLGGHDVVEPGVREHLLPGADRHGTLLEAEQVATAVLGDPPPSARSFSDE